jgi:hypothetical protein
VQLVQLVQLVQRLGRQPSHQLSIMRANQRHCPCQDVVVNASARRPAALLAERTLHTSDEITALEPLDLAYRRL